MTDTTVPTNTVCPQCIAYVPPDAPVYKGQRHHSGCASMLRHSDETNAARALDPAAPDWHIGRSWGGHYTEDTCPCPQQDCGLIRQGDADPTCEHHPIERVQSMRQVHAPENCPAAKAAARLAAMTKEP